MDFDCQLINFPSKSTRDH